MKFQGNFFVKKLKKYAPKSISMKHDFV